MSFFLPELKDHRINDHSTGDEEKENVGLFACGSQTRLSSEINGPLISDCSTKRSLDITLLDSSNSNNTDVLKETEQNLDYSKVIKKHKKKRAHENHANRTSLDINQNTAKHKKKKHSKHIVESG